MGSLRSLGHSRASFRVARLFGPIEMVSMPARWLAAALADHQQIGLVRCRFGPVASTFWGFGRLPRLQRRDTAAGNFAMASCGHDKPHRPALCSVVIIRHMWLFLRRLSTWQASRRRTWRAATRPYLLFRARAAALAGQLYQVGYAVCLNLRSAWRSASGASTRSSARSRRSRRRATSLLAQPADLACRRPQASSLEGVIPRRAHMFTVARQAAARGRHDELRRRRPLLHQGTIFVFSLGARSCRSLRLTFARPCGTQCVGGCDARRVRAARHPGARRQGTSDSCSRRSRALPVGPASTPLHHAAQGLAIVGGSHWVSRSSADAMSFLL